MDIKTDDTPTIEGLAIRCARLARSLLTWDDSRSALYRGLDLLDEWEMLQQGLPNQRDIEGR